LRRDEQGDERARLALDIYCTRIKSYLGAYLALLGNLDAIAFTAGIGEHSPVVRARALAGLQGLGIAIDGARNTAGMQIISPAGARITVCVVPTNEELEIALQTAVLLSPNEPFTSGPSLGG
jgi:acetate kinase